MNRALSKHLSPVSLCIATLVAVVLAATLAASHALAVPDAKSPEGRASSLVVAQADSLDAAAGGVAASAPDAVYSGVTVKANAKVKGKGWLGWKASGKTAGTTSDLGLRGFKLKLSGLTALTGRINYRTYDRGKGWGKTVANGKSSGRTGLPVQAVKIWLTGDVAAHYDVLYRVRVVGKGWQPWAKNKEVSGIAKKSWYLSAIQVKLSPKTEEAIGAAASEVGVRYEARMKKTGWQAWTGDGKKAGKTSEAVMDGFAVKVDAGNLSGGVRYRAYIQGKKWKQGWKKNGAAAGVSKKRIEALQIELTGALAQTHDIYYCTYVDGFGWLDWAKNGEVSGSTGKNLPASAVRVKLVKKEQAAPKSLASYPASGGEGGALRATTVNQLLPNLNGIDISSWQAGIDVAKVEGDFVIVKATGGTGYTNQYYKAMADATLKAGKLLGLYHFAREKSCPGTAKKEADHFVKAAGPYVGKAVLVLDFEADALYLKKAESWAKTFLDRVYAKTGVRPLIYMSKGITHSASYNWSTVAKDYKLWVAQYPNYKATGYKAVPWTDSYDFGPWKEPTIFQYTSTGRISGYNGDLDLDLFYGKRADWEALAKPSKPEESAESGGSSKS